ncbi:hypothetical protein [Blastococcus brunescens]|uniref:Uncharacterized protein n=1 Tax=Blastococcus brunescens TaxID=1564165 RepID=A0ABZ1B0J6_9ACTN|nr:hypothetical protein [Blastococcus sp. BMG 8361]WRL64333.1 hypothetical protein U6N30_00225 [Blastococcus sp. BMG 8361]
MNVLIVTYGSLREPLMVPLLRTCDRLACEIYFVPRLYEVHTVTRDTEVLWGVPLLRMRRAPFRTGTWAAKRISDVVLTSAVLVLLAPSWRCVRWPVAGRRGRRSSVRRASASTAGPSPC